MVFSLNEHGDLYFILHNFGVQEICLKIYRKEKNHIAKNVHKAPYVGM